MEEIAIAEKAILSELLPYRVRGRRGHPNEWLEGIIPEAVEQLVLSCLRRLELPFMQIGSVNGQRMP
ncbi:hypothetical protein D3C83_79310 [compost metagenome]